MQFIKEKFIEIWKESQQLEIWKSETDQNLIVIL